MLSPRIFHVQLRKIHITRINSVEQFSSFRQSQETYTDEKQEKKIFFRLSGTFEVFSPLKIAQCGFSHFANGAERDRCFKFLIFPLRVLRNAWKLEREIAFVWLIRAIRLITNCSQGERKVKTETISSENFEK